MQRLLLYMNRKNFFQQQTTEYSVKKEITLLPFIQECLNGISRNKAKAILSGNGIKVNKRITTQFDYPLEPGMIVQISHHKQKAEFRSRFVKLVYEDQWIVVVEKNIGILSMGINKKGFCIKTLLDEYFKKKHLKCTAHVVHRLDRDTSGLMIYAKSMEAETILEEHWHEIVTDRRYIALVSGKMEEKEGSIESWLKDNKAYYTYSNPTDNGGKYALTHYKTILSNNDYSLVELKLETGRKNQIRVHLKDLEHPVVGDVKYGNGDNPVGRLGLHAFRLHFYHPITRELLKFETPYPHVFKELFSKNKNRIPLSD